MLAPSDARRVQDLDARYIKSLKAKSVAFPTTNVSPLLANVKIPDDEEFDKEDLEKYKYEMIGGNISRRYFNPRANPQSPAVIQV